MRIKPPEVTRVRVFCGDEQIPKEKLNTVIIQSNEVDGVLEGAVVKTFLESVGVF